MSEDSINVCVARACCCYVCFYVVTETQCTGNSFLYTIFSILSVGLHNIYKLFKCNSSSAVSDQCSNAAQNTNLLGSIGPSLLDTLSGPNIVIILCQQVNNFLMCWTQKNLAQVKRGRSIATGLFISERRNLKIAQMCQDPK